MLIKSNKLKSIFELVLILSLREIKSRYKGSFLGPIWVIAYPLFLTAITTLVFSLFVKIETDHIPYGLFALSGIIVWNFFGKAINLGTRSLVSNRDLIVETAVYAEALPISYILGQLPDLLINFCLLLLLLLIFHFPLSYLIPFVVLVIVLLIILILGLTLLLSTLNVVYKDTQNLLEPLLLIWFYLTPVIYPLRIVPENYQWILKLNPISYVISMIRDVIFYQKLPNWIDLIILCLFSFGIFGVGYFIFRKNRPAFADII